MPDCDSGAIARLLAGGRDQALAGDPGSASGNSAVRLVGDEAIRREAARLAGAGGGPALFAAAKRGLELGLLRKGAAPERYARNLGSIGLAGQIRLLEAAVGVAGLGGLGGYVAEILARSGVGRLVLVDPDQATEDNLNRQLMVTEEGVGRAKADLARERVAAVNSATSVEAHRIRGTEDDFARIFAGASVVVDALDSVPSRFELLAAARRLGVPLVHGAIAGLAGHVTTVFPQDPGLETVYGRLDQRDNPQGVEAVVGNLAPTPALIAAAEVLEAIKIITGTGQPLRRKLLVLDLLTLYASVIEL